MQIFNGLCCINEQIRLSEIFETYFVHFNYNLTIEYNAIFENLMAHVVHQMFALIILSIKVMKNRY